MSARQSAARFRTAAADEMKFPLSGKHLTGMLTKNDFTAEEWNTIRDAPSLVGFATLMAGSSGLGTIKEAIAIGQGILENRDSSVPLLRDLTSTSETQAAQTSMREMFAGRQSKPATDTIRRLALEKVSGSLTLLNAKGSPEEIEAFKRMIYGVAERVSSAAREGGILGFGGAKVSEGEQTFLDELRGTLQLEHVRRA